MRSTLAIDTTEHLTAGDRAPPGWHPISGSDRQTTGVDCSDPPLRSLAWPLVIRSRCSSTHPSSGITSQRGVRRPRSAPSRIPSVTSFRRGSWRVHLQQDIRVAAIAPATIRRAETDDPRPFPLNGSDADAGVRTHPCARHGRRLVVGTRQ